ncbi:hydrolase [Actinoplanes cyaneus]|uniref:Hydrolase n=1 Tax=Actinoplanes cyaneus TaxID=52696 RepID=A0A919M9N9_9ACTN|nr:alpha/beta hydrolase [Actinoplanes cyaneus]MCW2139972.1 Pimeloyl-ACP methyl ester carboxylesterase [Actinoplanes cyaneus]GID67729.1 hydrolase [Actinoplanes cyaneus]
MLPTYDHHRGSGLTLVFLHYWGGSARTWQPVIDRLPGRDAVAVDARGWGRSRELPGPYTLDQLAQDTLDVVADAGLRDYVLVGHSMGGKVAQLVAATRPAGLTGLVLVAPGPAEPPAVVTAEYQEQLARAYDSDESVAGVRDHVLTATPLADDLALQVVADSRDSGPAARSEWPLRGIARDITARTREIDVPVLVVAGEHDRVEPVGALRAHLMPYLSRGDLEVVPGSGHLIPLEAPDALARAISAFVPS